MTDKHGKPLAVGDRVRWGSGLDFVRGVVRTIRPDPFRPGHEECVCDDGNPVDGDYITNGWTVLATLTARQVVKERDAIPAAEVERRERAELARLLAKYPDAAKEGK